MYAQSHPEWLEFIGVEGIEYGSRHWRWLADWLGKTLTISASRSKPRHHYVKPTENSNWIVFNSSAIGRSIGITSNLCCCCCFDEFTPFVGDCFEDINRSIPSTKHQIEGDCVIQWQSFDIENPPSSSKIEKSVILNKFEAKR